MASALCARFKTSAAAGPSSSPASSASSGTAGFCAAGGSSDSPGRDSLGRDSLGRDSLGRDSLGRDSLGSGGGGTGGGSPVRRPARRPVVAIRPPRPAAGDRRWGLEPQQIRVAVSIRPARPPPQAAGPATLTRSAIGRECRMGIRNIPLPRQYKYVVIDGRIMLCQPVCVPNCCGLPAKMDLAAAATVMLSKLFTECCGMGIRIPRQPMAVFHDNITRS